ncbi:hypothetical protein EYR36_005966 [Pleurotus pulmonarius]|nr:hypothetical protein EYR36_005966 [Pleurotus pulmonarius]KAF4600674.1 hypothetical protein EYR38_005317 [Pleurotus pulmonarius]
MSLITPDEILAKPTQLTAFRFWDKHIPFQPWDGLVGALIPQYCQFITSPNVTEIPEPLLSPQQNVILREDGRWGPDDPFRCPQLYQRVYCHHACVLKPVKEQSDPLSILWWTPTVSELKTDLAVNNMFTIPDPRLAQFQQCLTDLLGRFEKEKASLLSSSNEIWVNILVNQLQIWFNRLSNFTSTVPNVIFMVAEFQRRYLDLRAYVDYMLLVKRNLNSTHASAERKFPTPHPFLGSITYDVQVAEDFATTGVPVWLIRDLSEFSSKVRIKALVSMQNLGSSLPVQPFPGVSHSVFVGPSGSLKKYNAIYQYSREHFSKFESETDFVLPPPPPQASTRIASRAHTTKKPRISIVKTDLLKFTEGNHPFWPPMLPAWSSALKLVNTSSNRVVDIWVPGDNAYRFPDPHIFIPPEQGAPSRVCSYFITWHNFGDVICLAQSSAHFKRLSSPQWQELLLLAFKERMSFKENSGAAQRSEEMTKLLRDWATSSKVQFSVHSRNTAEFYGETITLDSLPSTKIARSELYRLCELNFRSDLRALDEYMHQAPPSSRRSKPRDELLSSCFPEWMLGLEGGDFITISDTDGFRGLAAPTIEERRVYILQLAKLMSSWCGVPTSISGPATTMSTSIDVESLERNCATFFAQSFFDRFARAPIVPRYLERR